MSVLDRWLRGQHADPSVERQAAELTGRLDSVVERLEAAVEDLEAECDDRERPPPGTGPPAPA